MELTECEGVAACFLLWSPPAASPDLSYTSRPYVHIGGGATVVVGVPASRHGSRTRGLVAGMGTPGDGRQPKPSGDVGTWIGDGIPRRRRM